MFVYSNGLVLLAAAYFVILVYGSNF